MQASPVREASLLPFTLAARSQIRLEEVSRQLVNRQLQGFAFLRSSLICVLMSINLLPGPEAIKGERPVPPLPP